MLLELILSSSAMITPAFADVDPSDLAAVNAANLSGPAPTVCVNPIEHALLAPDDKELTDIETPIGKVDAIARDISFIKNAVDTTKDVTGAAVEVAHGGGFSWLQVLFGAAVAFVVCFIGRAWSKAVGFIQAVNAVLKKVDERSKDD